MKKKHQNITNKLLPVFFIFFLVLIWQLISYMEIVPKFMLPSPIDSIKAFFIDFKLIMSHSKTTFIEAFYGIILSIIISVIFAILMNEFDKINKTIYPLLVISQTIPTIALAPLLVLWLGYGIAPKITLIVITCFFPLCISTLGGLNSVDKDEINLLKTMGATRWQILYFLKIPHSLDSFFSGLKVSVSYAIIGAVISEWLGGNSGLGVYMTRVRKSYSFDKMFAIIIFITICSIILIYLVDFIQKKSMKWKFMEN